MWIFLYAVRSKLVRALLDLLRASNDRAYTITNLSKYEHDPITLRGVRAIFECPVLLDTHGTVQMTNRTDLVRTTLAEGAQKDESGVELGPDSGICGVLFVFEVTRLAKHHNVMDMIKNKGVFLQKST